jgi:chromosome segregation ATPase
MDTANENLTTIETFSSRVKELEAALADSHKASEGLRSVEDAAAGKEREFQARVDDLEFQLSAYKEKVGQVDDLKSKVSKLEEQLMDAEEKSKNLDTMAQQLKELEDKLAASEKYATENDDLRDKVLDLEDKVKDTQTKEKQIQELREKLEEALAKDEQIHQLTDKVVSLQNQLANSSVTDVNESELLQRITNLQEHLVIAKKKEDEDEAEKEELADMLADAEGMLEETKMELETLKIQIGGNTALSPSGGSNTKSLESRIDELQKTNAYLLSQLESSHEQMEVMERERFGGGGNVMDSVKESLAFQIKAAFQQVAVISEEKDAISKENAVLHKKIASLLEQLQAKE